MQVYVGRRLGDGIAKEGFLEEDTGLICDGCEIRQDYSISVQVGSCTAAVLCHVDNSHRGVKRPCWRTDGVVRLDHRDHRDQVTV